jgi:hypothetical protein
MVDHFRKGHFTAFMSAIVDRQARKRIQALEERAVRRNRETVELSARLSRGAADFARLAATVEAIRASSPPHSPAVPPNPPTPAPSTLSISATKLPNATSAAAAPDHPPPPPLPSRCPLRPRALLP